MHKDHADIQHSRQCSALCRPLSYFPLFLAFLFPHALLIRERTTRRRERHLPIARSSLSVSLSALLLVPRTRRSKTRPLCRGLETRFFSARAASRIANFAAGASVRSEPRNEARARLPRSFLSLSFSIPLYPRESSVFNYQRHREE